MYFYFYCFSVEVKGKMYYSRLVPKSLVSAGHKICLGAAQSISSQLQLFSKSGKIFAVYEFVLFFLIPLNSNEKRLLIWLFPADASKKSQGSISLSKFSHLITF
jgi:hypothetical protein